MLAELHIENVAVISVTDLRFGPGFNVLTGETGAGKSIVIDAIGAVLGGRVNRELVRAGTRSALVSAVFTDCAATDWLAENDLEPADELILQRRIGADGKSSARVNGAPVTAQQLRSLSALLLDMHGQNDGRQLLDESRHLDYLDRFAADEAQRSAYAEAYGRWRDIRREMERLSMDELDKARLSERLAAQVTELEAAKLRPGEEAELLALRERMRHGEKLSQALEGAYEALYGAEDNAIALALRAERHVSNAAAVATELREAAEGIAQARFLLEDAAERVNDVRGSLSFSEEEYNAVEERLSLLRRLQRKYGCDAEALPTALETARARLSELESADDLLRQLERELERARRELLRAGEALSARRREAAQALAGRVRTELRDLSMPSVRFLAELSPKGGAGFDSSGCDELRFLMSANAGAPPGRLSHIASGGEMSRVMLALKSVFAERDAVGTLVFDEIDTGVSGVAAQRVGEKMARLSAHRQLICITHLPQIAAMADRQFYIEKTERDGQAFTTVRPLDQAGRVRELARLHGGDAVTETTLRSAREQLAAAEQFKRKERSEP